MKQYPIQFKKFEILDEKDNLLAAFAHPEQVEEFFDVIDEHKTQDYIVQAFDENDLLLDTWYMPDIITGNFRDDVEKTQRRQNR